jgi:hypothetical protein
LTAEYIIIFFEFTKKTYKAINTWGALWPEHLNIKELDQIMQDYFTKGQGYLFYQEYQNDPVSDENRKFKLKKKDILEITCSNKSKIF